MLHIHVINNFKDIFKVNNPLVSQINTLIYDTYYAKFSRKNSL